MIVIHIGLRKAGSASLQAFLSANAEALAARGVEYPRIGRLEIDRTAHVNLAHDLVGSRKFDPAYGTLAQLGEHWRASAGETLLISSEMFEGCNPAHVGRLRDALRRGSEPIRIVLVLRPLADAMVSSYGQKVKYGANSHDFDAFFAGRIVQSRVDFHRTARQWASVLGWDSLRIVPLRPEGDLIGDFLAAAGIDGAGLTRTPSINITPGWKVLETVRGLYQGRHGLPGDHLFADAAEHAPEQRRMFGKLAMAVGERWGWNAERGQYLTRAQAERCEEIQAGALAALKRDMGADLAFPRTTLAERPFLPAIEHVPDFRAFTDEIAAEPAPTG